MSYTEFDETMKSNNENFVPLEKRSGKFNIIANPSVDKFAPYGDSLIMVMMDKKFVDDLGGFLADIDLDPSDSNALRAFIAQIKNLKNGRSKQPHKRYSRMQNSADEEENDSGEFNLTKAVNEITAKSNNDDE